MTKERGRKAIATNRKARHLYTVLDTAEAGIALVGNEVKSLRLGPGLADRGLRDRRRPRGVVVQPAHRRVRHGRRTNHAIRRKRKLLLHRTEILKWELRVRESGLSMVPLSMYFGDGLVKVELALVRGKKTWDKRHDLAERDAQREIERAWSRH